MSMTNKVALSLLVVGLATQASAQTKTEWKCVAVKDKGPQISLERLKGGVPVAGMVRVQTAQIDEVNFLAWENGPFKEGEQSHLFVTMIYDNHSQTEARAWDARTKDVKIQTLKTEKGTYSLVCK
jgi:hypothetical protein